MSLKGKPFDEPLTAEDRVEIAAKKEKKQAREAKKMKQRNLEKRYEWLQIRIAYFRSVETDGHIEISRIDERIAELVAHKNKIIKDQAEAPKELPVLRLQLEQNYKLLNPEAPAVDHKKLEEKAIKMAHKLRDLLKEMKSSGLSADQIALLQKSMEMGSNAGQEERV